ncbi:MAG: cation:proton antiporter [Ignavibacteriales bacterium]|nr:cation:proton antiporter [Ignavibacteriales bacterium]
MHNIHEFLYANTIVLCVAAVTTVLFQRLRQPVVIGYIFAGLIVGPHVPIPLVADPNIVTTLSELGVILLMFSLGLEFSLKKLMQVGSTSAIIAVLETSVMLWLGFMAGRLFGWTTLESIFAGAIIAISSTTIIAKVFDEQKVTGKIREIVVGVLIVEDLIGIIFMALFTGIASGQGLGAGAMAMTIAKLVLFLGGLIGIGMLLIPRMMRVIRSIDRKETTLVASIGICFAVSLIAREFGYSVALGAFLAGSLIAEAGEEKYIEHLVEPVRDMFAAVFFVSVGMMIDPTIVVRYLPAIIVLTLIVIIGKSFGVAAGSFLTGNSMRVSVQTGRSMTQIGEFSFIIAGLGLTLNATGEFLYPIAVAVSAVTTLTTPLLIRSSGPLVNFIDRKLPKPLQTFGALYGSWIEEMRSRSEQRKTVGPVRHLLRRMLLDAAFLAAIIIGTSVGMDPLVEFLRRFSGASDTVFRSAAIAAALLAAFPFCRGIVRMGEKLGIFFARMALPGIKEKSVDLVAAPRRMFVVTLQLLSVLVVGIPLLALTQPFLPGITSASLLVTMLGALAVIFWRSAADLHGHVRAGAEVVVAALKFPSRESDLEDDNGNARLKQVHHLLPGLGDLVAVTLSGGCSVIGRTLADLNLRGLTGATVLAVIREKEGVVFPGANEPLQENDVLALSGTHEAVASAKELLQAQQ